MKFVMIVGPFIRDPEGQKLKFEAMALDLWRLGFFVFNPIANCYYMFGKVPESTFVAGNVEAIKKWKFDAAILLDGWQDSSGSLFEIKALKGTGTKLFESLEELVKWRDEVEKV